VRVGLADTVLEVLLGLLLEGVLELVPVALVVVLELVLVAFELVLGLELVTLELELTLVLVRELVLEFEEKPGIHSQSPD
jgi:hypothetical protein